MFIEEHHIDVRSELERKLENIHKKQEALQEPGAINKFLDEIRELSLKVEGAGEEEFEDIKLRAVEIGEINVGVVENPDVYLQGEVNNEVARLTDEIFKREHPRVFALAREAVLRNLPKGIDIYNGNEVRNKLILASLEHVPSVLREGLFFKRWQIVAGVKPIRSSALVALRKAEFGGGGGELKWFGEYEELEKRLEKFEEDIEVDSQKQDLFKEYISSRHDRVRCRVFTNTKFSLNFLMADVRYRGVDLIRKVIGEKPEWNYYMSKWLYKNNGEVRISEIADRGGPASSFGYFLNEASDLNPEDLIYAAWHAQLKFRPIFGSKVPVEIQVFPIEFAAMHNVLQGIFKRDKPEIQAVSLELRMISNRNAKKFLESE
jgi:hypothetical protein